MPDKTRHDFNQPICRCQKAASKLAAVCCGSVHSSLMWPIHAQSQRRGGGGRFPVPWAGDGLFPMREMLVALESLQIPRSQIRKPFSQLRSALLPQVVMLAILLPLHVQPAEAPMVDFNDGAAMAFARYTAGLAETRPWNLETIEIDASLPRLEKQGRLRAIRRLLPPGRPEYQVLETAGDPTVREQVIFRYLTAEAQAGKVAASSVAITPANYKFSYKGTVKTAGAIAYSFVIKPHKKRPGLIKGEMWLDGETGSVVRLSGYLVKNPSIFIKRIVMNRETVIRDGRAEERITHLSIYTRLVGRAELNIHEHPYIDPDSAGVGDASH